MPGDSRLRRWVRTAPTKHIENETVISSHMHSFIHKSSALFTGPGNPVKILAIFAALFQGGSFPAVGGNAVDPASAGAIPSVPEIASKGYILAFSDEFNGTQLDENKWQYRVDSKGRSTQLPANVTVSDGSLHVAVKKEPARGKDYTAGGIISKTEFIGSVWQRSGRCEFAFSV